MIEYRCSQCKRKYGRYEYLELDKASRVTDDPDDEYGVESICECGNRFHSDKWQLWDDIEVEDEEMSVSTVALTIPHGLDHEQWYESLVIYEEGNHIFDRYSTEKEAQKGHERIVKAINDENFYFDTELVTKRFKIENSV